MDALEQVITRLKYGDPAAIASVTSVAALLVVLKWALNSKAQKKTKFITNFADVSTGVEYDVIVIGGGRRQFRTFYSDYTDVTFLWRTQVLPDVSLLPVCQRTRQ